MSITNPIVYSFPVKRPGHLVASSWLGGNDDLALQCSYYDPGEIIRAVSYATRTTDYEGDICVPTSTDVAGMGPRVRDILAAHVRMAVMIRGQAIPGSIEFEQILNEQLLAANFQTSIGTVKITAVNIVDDQCVDLEFQRGSGMKRTYRFDQGELQSYFYVPNTQLLVVPGAVKKQFPNYVHDYEAGVFLTQAQKDDIAAYVLTLAPWI